MNSIRDYVVFNDEKLARKYEHEPIPMSVLYEAYFDGDIDVPGDIFDLLKKRSDFVKYPITRQHLQWAVTNFVPDMVHTKNQDERMMREVFDRGNDFFEYFLGESMVYTAGHFDADSDSLQTAQQNQFRRVSEQLQLAAGERLLDIGCGWGSLVRHCASSWDVDATGVTLAEKQVSYGRQLIVDAGLSDCARMYKQDYRDLAADEKYHKIACMEMIEHVGLKNLGSFCERVYDLLEDDGLFLLQWTGVRRALKQEDLIWGLFISKYIFPGADASLPPSSMIKALDKAGFELHSLENVSGHYARTLRAWRKNWLSNKQAVLAAYGERWFRIWNFYLAWSVLVVEEGNASCYQAVLNKNVASFDRSRWIVPPRRDSGESRPFPELEGPAAVEQQIPPPQNGVEVRAEAAGAGERLEPSIDDTGASTHT
jgi:sphingolipid C9-methyltransferase